MSIQPVSDIVLDVAMAADPAKAQAATQKLASAADAASFDVALSGAGASPSAGWSDVARARFFNAKGEAAAKAATPDEAKKGLETLLVKMMVDSILPKEGGAVFGKGSSAHVWRSVLSEKLADEMTRGQGLGLLRNVALTRGEA